MNGGCDCADGGYLIQAAERLEPESGTMKNHVFPVRHVIPLGVSHEFHAILQPATPILCCCTSAIDAWSAQRQERLKVPRPPRMDAYEPIRGKRDFGT